MLSHATRGGQAEDASPKVAWDARDGRGEQHSPVCHKQGPFRYAILYLRNRTIYELRISMVDTQYLISIMIMIQYLISIMKTIMMLEIEQMACCII